MPIAGRIRIYTSGWPKYQKRCCHRSGSPPPDGLNQLVPSVRSKRSIATPEVRTGSASRSRIAVMKRDRKSTRLNSSHVSISYAVFCLKKKKKEEHQDKSVKTAQDHYSLP